MTPTAPKSTSPAGNDAGSGTGVGLQMMIGMYFGGGTYLGAGFEPALAGTAAAPIRTAIAAIPDNVGRRMKLWNSIHNPYCQADALA
jgi:hypothetical protein